MVNIGLASTHQRLSTQFNIDNLFNFFVTAYHIQDYIKTSEAVDVTVLKEFMEDPDMKSCRDLCDQGKHLRLTWNNRVDPKTRIVSGCYGDSAYGTHAYAGRPAWILITDSRMIDESIYPMEC